MKEKIEAILKARFLLLFVSFILLFIAYPFLGKEAPAEQVIVDVLFLFILIGAIRAVVSNRKLLVICVAMTALSQLLAWTNLFAPRMGLLEVRPYLLAARAVVDLPLYTFFTVAILAYILRQERITADTIFAAICVYAMIGFIWAAFYATIDLCDPTAFNFGKLDPGPTGEAGREMALIYFSYVTLTTLGYGDITPASRIVSSLACVEAMIGQLFLATLIARLVGLHIISHTRDRQSSSHE